MLLYLKDAADLMLWLTNSFYPTLKRTFLYTVVFSNSTAAALLFMYTCKHVNNTILLLTNRCVFCAIYVFYFTHETEFTWKKKPWAFLLSSHHFPPWRWHTLISVAAADSFWWLWLFHKVPHQVKRSFFLYNTTSITLTYKDNTKLMTTSSAEHLENIQIVLFLCTSCLTNIWVTDVYIWCRQEWMCEESLVKPAGHPLGWFGSDTEGESGASVCVTTMWL